jgi:hypothetical protein
MQEQNSANEFTIDTSIDGSCQLWTRDKTTRITVEFKIKKLVELQRLIAEFGGDLTLHRMPISVGNEEPLYWFTLNIVRDNICIFARTVNLPAEIYELNLKSFNGHRCILFREPKSLILIDGSYFILPDDTSKIWFYLKDSNEGA